MLEALIDRSSFWALVGVALGFLLGEGSRVIRHLIRVRRLKRMIRHEMASIRAQIPQKLDILRKMRDVLRSGGVLSGVSVSAIDTGFRQHGPELYPYLAPLERNCLHVIYGRLSVADRLMDSFESDLVRANAEGIIDDPFMAYSHRLQELEESYQVVSSLIDGYLAGKPTDVFAVGG